MSVSCKAVTRIKVDKSAWFLWEKKNESKQHRAMQRSQTVEGASATYQEAKQTLKEFQEAVNRRDRAEINRLLRKGVNINAINEAGDTPLHQCIRDGRIESAKLLVELGADVKRANRDGWSPAHLATSLGQRDLLLYLLLNSDERWGASSGLFQRIG